MTCWMIADTAVVDLTDIVLKLPHPVVPGSNFRMFSLYDFWHELVRLHF
jgi:hypothetical protein